MASKVTLRAQLLALQALIVCLVTLAAGISAGAFYEDALRDSYTDRMHAIAQSVANLPMVIGAFDDPQPSSIIQPIAEIVREASDLEYVVVANADGIRYSHPNPERIGERVSTDPSVPLSGETYIGTQTGTLGETLRVKVPIFDGNGEVIGTASVGILESVLGAELGQSLFWIVLTMVIAAILGVLGAAWVTAIIRKRIYSLEPHEIAALVQNRETVMHRLSEGVIVVESNGMISLVNDAAAELLGSSVDELTGAHIVDALPDDLFDIFTEGESAGRPVIVGPRVVIARSTGAQQDGSPVEATLLLRDHTELHDVVRRVDAADAIIAFRERLGLPKGLSAETLERVIGGLAESPDSSASEIGEALGMSRVSARRYLEHLASNGRATRTLDYSTKGRPGTRYRSVDGMGGK